MLAGAPAPSSCETSNSIFEINKAASVNVPIGMGTAHVPSGHEILI